METASFKSNLKVRLSLAYTSEAENSEAHIDKLMREVRQAMGETKQRMEAFGIVFKAETEHMVTYEASKADDTRIMKGTNGKSEIKE
jgi:translation initiation factor 2B subunit (eIF-2B alpha/beta/delta family)